jgi:SPX domain protein involved in polyphosphate accumulation
VASEDSFTNFDLGPFFEHWADSLQEIRYAMGVGQARSGLTSASQSPAINPMAPKQSSLTVSRSINEALSVASDVDFDAILAAAPLGSDGSRAIYWVHPEQLVELQVLLLQHTRLAFPKSSSPGSTSASDTPTITRRSSLSTPRRDSFFERELSSGIVVFDDPEEFALLQNTLPIADSENSHLRSPTEAAMTTRWSNGGDLLLSLRHKPDNEASNTVPSSARLKTKHFASFLDFERNFVPRLSSELDLSNSTTSHNQDQLSAARKWLSENRKVQPLVGIFSRRSRFVNLTSGKDCGQWCVLDIDISLKKVGFGDLEGKEWPLNITHDATKFPFAVLEVRQEGKANVDLIKLLDESYLVSR